MSRTERPIRFGPPTTASLQVDMTVVRRILSDRCADVDGAARHLAQLATESGAPAPTLGYHAQLVYPAPIDREALALVRDEALRSAQVRLRASLDLIESLIGPR